MNKKIFTFRLFPAIFAMCIFCGCATTKTVAPAPTPVQPRKKIAFFLDNGCVGRAVFCWVKLLTNSPELEVEFINGKMLRKNKLDKFDLFFCPGGGSARQLGAMQKKGQ